jgi:hypothetical protein
VAQYTGWAVGGVGGAGQGSKEANTSACAAEEENDSVRVIVAVLHGRRQLGDVLFSLATLETTGTESWVG